MTNLKFPVADQLRLQYYQEVIKSVDESSIIYPVFMDLYNKLKKELEEKK